MIPILTSDSKPDYFIAQFPGGGQRGFATVLLLDWFERKTGLPTHQLFPYVTTGSVGILIASALYLPHPEHPHAAMMSARQLVERFPDIASRTPRKAAIFKNRNDRQPFEDVLKLFIGDAKLKDLLGTVFFSSHEIGGVSESHKTPFKMIHPETGEVTYDGDPESKILDYALAGTALPAVFPSYHGHIDLAFSDTYADSIYTIKSQFNHTAKGAFIRVGNFRDIMNKSSKHLENGGMTSVRHIIDAISDASYARTIKSARACFGKFVFNLEQEIPFDYPNPPTTTANVTTSEQFQKIRVMTGKYIENNLEALEALAVALKEIALKRIANHPRSAFGIPPIIQEFPLIEIPDLHQNVHKTSTYAFGYSAGRLARGVEELCDHTLRSLFSLVKSPPVIKVLESLDKTLLPSYQRNKDREPL